MHSVQKLQVTKPPKFHLSRPTGGPLGPFFPTRSGYRTERACRLCFVKHWPAVDRISRGTGFWNEGGNYLGSFPTGEGTGGGPWTLVQVYVPLWYCSEGAPIQHFNPQRDMPGACLGQ